MAVVKSTSVTNLDATPVVRNTSGEGGKGYLKHVGDFATTTANTVQVVKLVRVPTTAKVKAVFLEAAAQTQGTFDIGCYFSSSTTDGTAAANAGNTILVAFFASAVDCSSAVVRTNEINESGTNTVALRNEPLWQALSLSFDPGGYIDICASNTNTTTTGGLISVEVEYVE